MEIIDYSLTNLCFETKVAVGSILISNSGRIMIAGLSQGKNKAISEKRPGAVRAYQFPFDPTGQLGD